MNYTSPKQTAASVRDKARRCTIRSVKWAPDALWGE